MTNYIKGIDISAVQPPNINFKAVYDAGNRFIIARCGVGNDGTDHNCYAYLKAAKAAGLKCMVYHVIYPLRDDPAHPGRNPIDQANAHFKAANGEIACCDFEFPPPEDWGKYSLTSDFIREWLWQYMEEYSRLSGKPMTLYSYPYYVQATKLDARFAKYPLWIASYQANVPQVPAPWGKDDWVMWQTTGGGGKLPSGAPVDTNVCKDMSIFDGIQTVVQPPTPVPTPNPIPVGPIPMPQPISGGFWSFVWNVLKVVLHIK